MALMSYFTMTIQSLTPNTSSSNVTGASNTDPNQQEFHIKGSIAWTSCYGYVLNAWNSIVASQHRKHRGYRTQRVVADYLKQWWPSAESTGAGRIGSDCTGVPFDIEVKARASFQPKAWLDQVKARRKDVSTGQQLSFVVMRLNGQGEDAGGYAAMLPFDDLITLLVKAGWTNPTINRCGCGSWLMQGSDCKVCTILDGRL